MHLIKQPDSTDIEKLIKLSTEFSFETEWSKYIPIGSIDSKEKAYERLLGPNAKVVLTAKVQGELIGYTGILKNNNCYEISILINKNYRNCGLGRNLIDTAFTMVPKHIEVEAWIADFNALSLKTIPKMNFRFKEKFLETDLIPNKSFYVSIFTRNGDKEGISF